MALERTKTAVEVWNRAISRVSQSTRVQDEADASQAAEVCRLHYADCLGELLEDFPWSWAKGQSNVAALSTVTRVGWEYAYNLPTDCLVPRAILDGEVRIALVPGETRVPWELQANDTRNGKVLCTDADLSDAALEYTAWVETVEVFPRLFVDALAWRLAGELALGLAQSSIRYETIMDPDSGLFVRAFAKAAAADLRGRQDDPEQDAPSIRARA